MLVLLLVSVLFAVAGFFYLSNGSRAKQTSPASPRTSERGLPALPPRVRNPQNCVAAHPDGVWKFRSGDSCCKTAARLNNRRLETRHAIVLPLPACDLAACACEYRAAPNLRKRDRRVQMDRRDGIRMEHSKEDRRKGVDRRKTNNSWRTGAY